MGTLGGHDSGDKTLRCAGVKTYVDVAQIWFSYKHRPEDIRWVRERCGDGEPHDLDVRNQPMQFCPGYVERFQMRRPTDDALDFCSDGLLNFLELAHELVCSTEDDRQHLFEFVTKHFVKRHHQNQGVRFVGKRPGNTKAERFDSYQAAVAAGVPADQVTYYTGQRWQHPHVVKIYQGTSKIRSAPCLRIEWMASGAPAVRAIVRSSEDLVDFDHAGFWRERLLLYGLDIDRLGRMVSNRQDKTKRRTNQIIRHGKFSYDVDRRMGQTTMRIAGHTVLGVIDLFGARAMSKVLNRMTPNVDTIIPDGENR